MLVAARLGPTVHGIGRGEGAVGGDLHRENGVEFRLRGRRKLEGPGEIERLGQGERFAAGIARREGLAWLASLKHRRALGSDQTHGLIEACAQRRARRVQEVAPRALPLPSQGPHVVTEQRPLVIGGQIDGHRVLPRGRRDNIRTSAPCARAPFG